MRSVFILIVLVGLANISFAAVPIVENVSIIGSVPSDNLTLTWDAYDGDADPVRNFTVWYKDGEMLPVIYLPFEGTSTSVRWTDHAGYDNNVTSATGVSYSSTGGHDGYGAYYFPGTTDYLTLSTTNFPYIGSGNYTAMAWVQTSSGVYYNLIFGFNNYNPSYYISGGNQLEIYDSGYYTSPSSKTINDGNWHHVAFVRRGTGANQLEFYVDGVSLGSATHSASDVSASTIRIGYDGYDDFTGTIDDFRFYNRSFTSEQIQAFAADLPHVIVSQETSLGENWTGCVTPNDGGQDGAAVCDSVVVQPPIDVSSCQELNGSGTYQLTANLSGANVSYGSDLTCLKITGSDAILDCNGNTITNNGTGGTTYGILVDGSAQGTKIRNCPGVEGYTHGVFVQSSNDVNIDPSYFCNNAGNGITVNASNNTVIDDSVACNNTAYGIQVIDSINTIIQNSRLYNNARDLMVNNTGGSPYDLVLSRVVFDNPAGSLTNHTDLSMQDSVSGGSAYSLNWSGQPAALDANFESLDSKYLEISNLSGTVNISSLTWHWEESEPDPGDETRLVLAEHDGSSWSYLNSSPDTTGNTLSLDGHVPSSVYALLVNLSATPGPAPPVAENVTITGWGNDDNLVLNWDGYDLNDDEFTNITNWYKDGTSFTLLNVPFEGGDNDTNAKDYSGNGYHAVSDGSSDPIFNSTAGHDGYGAMEFFYSGTELNLGGDATLSRSATKNVSFEIWVNPSVIGASDYVGGFMYTWSQGYGFYMDTSPNELCFHINSYNTYYACAPITTGVWQHYVGTYNGSEIAIYVNGTKYATDVYTGTITGPHTWTDFCLGNYCGGSSTYQYYGFIDGVRVYDHALDAGQIALLYSGSLKTIHSDETATGQNWSGCVTPNDRTADGTQVCSSNTTIDTDPRVAVNVSSCLDITSSGLYRLNTSLSGAPVSAGGGQACIRITADDVELACDGNDISNNGTGGTTYGILIDSTTQGVKIRDCPMVDGYTHGAYVLDSTAVNIDPSWFCDNTNGITVVSSNDTIIDDSIACNNTQSGILVLDSDGTSITDSRAYNNGRDLLVNNTLGSAIDLSMSNVTFDNPSGVHDNFTVLGLVDSVSAGTAYLINWTTIPAALPPNTTSFEQKYVEISNLTSGVSLDSVTWSWLTSELPTYQELNLGVWKHNGSWSDTNATLNAGANTLTLTNHNPASDYAILEMAGPASLTECIEITTSGEYLLENSLSGAPIVSSLPSGNTCILIDATDVTLDCQGYNLSHTTTSSTFGIVTTSSAQNITIRNCEVYGYYYGYYNYLSDYVDMFNNTAQDFGYYGIYLSGNYNNIVNNTFVRVTSGSRAMMLPGSYNNITNNTASASSSCIYSSGGDYNRYVGNDAYYTGSGEGIFLTTSAHYNLIENNTVHDVGRGIYVSGSSNNDIINNTIYDTASIGIQVYSGSTTNTVERNHLDNPGLGIYVISNVNLNDIIGNDINGSSNGIYLDSGADNTDVINNTIGNSSSSGIYVSSSTTDNVLLSGNDVHNAQFGIRVSSATGTTLVDNTVSGNSFYGAYVNNAVNTNITRDHYYDNAVDLWTNAVTTDKNLYLNEVVFDNPAGDGQDATTFSMSDLIEAGTTIEMEWVSSAVAPPAGGWFSFADKTLSISNVVGSQTIDSMTFHWTDAEAAGYNESTFYLWKYNGTWSNTNATLDPDANTLTLLSHLLGSNYSILSNFTSVANIDLFGANVTNHSHHARYNGTGTGNLSTEGGNITGTNISSSMLTERWAAFYGNVSGGIVLTGISGSGYVYSWNWSTADGGVVCLSTDGALSQLGVLGANGTDIDNAWSFAPSESDSATNTFNYTNCTLDIGGASVANASYVDTGPAGGFVTCTLKSAQVPTKPEMLFCSDIIGGGTFWNGGTGDFEVMVPTNVTGTETYYFYMNVD